MAVKIQKNYTMPNFCRSSLKKGVLKNNCSSLLRNVLSTSEKDFAEISGISLRTYSRIKPDEMLPAQAAEVAISLLRTMEKAEEIFGSQEKAAKWIKSENPVLGTTPFKAMASRFGAEEVMNILGRIEYGVYS
ncbi:MAG: DUF2384 domain-containing protein [Treponema sp.]|nr:DUF2384 domain-containing protein [Candidatus Treponema equifaecale]